MIIDAAKLQATVVQTTAKLEANPGGGVIRPSVEARLAGDTRLEITFDQFGRSFTLESDEPAGRGGHGTAPTAIRYFLTGIASCLGVWFAKGAALTGCELHGLTLRVEAALDMRVEYGLLPSGEPEQLLVEVEVDSPSPDGVVLAMTHEAFARCPLWNLVTRGIPGVRRVRLNGRELVDGAPLG